MRFDNGLDVVARIRPVFPASAPVTSLFRTAKLYRSPVSAIRRELIIAWGASDLR